MSWLQSGEGLSDAGSGGGTGGHERRPGPDQTQKQCEHWEHWEHWLNFYTVILVILGLYVYCNTGYTRIICIL